MGDEGVLMGSATVHRTNLYPLVHSGLIHAVVNLVALTPLLERFEREVGTLKTVLLIAGRESIHLFSPRPH